ncbi:hypothetical protein TWF730_001952 [Orbilia blumenaviensis]|uniref:Gfo/Idh/MocA-like oxidoreductase N-terminal domain-containing protein n=1 Tax=Orbilia blumenaviensis TaxID=1796055 RepID=A0AAV9UGB2_9PEZI
MSLKYHPPIRIGLIGCGEIAQVAHIPNLTYLSSKFELTYLCDTNAESLAFCASRCSNASIKCTESASDLCQSPDVDAVMVCSSDAFHTEHGLLALKAGKHVFIEKPLALCRRDIKALMEAEKGSKGKVFVGYMRRYASAFLDAVKEIGGVEGVQYVKVRDIICPNSVFINQSGTFPYKFPEGVTQEAAKALAEREESMVHEALEVDMGLTVTEKRTTMLRLLGGLGSHDLSAMRELIGMPTGVLGAYLTPTMWTVLFKYPTFVATYESGFNSIPLFDASIEVFTENKAVTVKYDTPYVKGLPTTMVVREKVGEDNCGYQERIVRSSYEDPYTKQMGEWWEFMVNGKPVKTTVEDAAMELEIFKMILTAAG